MDPHSGHPPDPIIGQTIGNYLVTQKLGEGGMGAVYLAEHPHIGKKVALKVLHSEFASNPEVVSRFFHEAKAVNDIQHPNIVDIIDYGVLQHGNDRLVYFIMEYLAGSTLSHLIRAEAPLPPERAFAIGLQVADALAASHRCQIVHRDLKPDNIILGQRGRERDFVKLLDFGIAKLTGDQPGSRRTRTGIVMGTPAYMSPEQCDGRGQVDHRTDIYALGIVLYEMLTGRVPFLGEGYGEILVQHLTQPPTRPSQFRVLPPHVEAVVLKALEKRPELRYPTMEDMMRALADPVGYVEANGGLQGFSQQVLVPSNAPLDLAVRPTPSPLTPAPGHLSPVSQMSHLSQHGYASGIMVSPPTSNAQTPTTLGGSSGQVAGAGHRTMGLVALAVVVVAAAAVAVVLVLRRDRGGPEVAQVTPDAALAADAAVAAVVVDAPAAAADAATAVAVVDAAPALDARTAEVPPVPAVPVDAPPALTPQVTFVIRTDPIGATVKIAGQTGTTPFEVTLERTLGQVSYTIELAGYFPRKDKVDLAARDIALPIYKLDKKRSGKNGTRPKDGQPKPPEGDTDLMRPPGT